MGAACPASLFELRRMGCIICTAITYFAEFGSPSCEARRAKQDRAIPIRYLRFLGFFPAKRRLAPPAFSPVHFPIRHSI
jgi:hypothetical protein